MRKILPFLFLQFGKSATGSGHIHQILWLNEKVKKWDFQVELKNFFLPSDVGGNLLSMVNTQVKVALEKVKLTVILKAIQLKVLIKFVTILSVPVTDI